MRDIAFNGVHSLFDLGLTIAPYPDTRATSPTPRIIRETVPYMSGSYDFSKIGGEIILEDITLTYAFNLHGSSAAELEETRSSICEWLTGAAGTELYDDHFDGWHFTNVTLKTLGDLEYVSRFGRNARMSVTFAASPYMEADNAYDPLRSVPSDYTQALTYSSVNYSDDGTTALLTYSLADNKNDVMCRLPIVSSCKATATANGTLRAQGTEGGYFYIVADKAVTLISLKLVFPLAIAQTVVESNPSAARFIIYSEELGRKRRLV